MTETPSPKDKLQNMNTRQKAIAGISAAVFLFLIWLVVGMFGGKDESVPKNGNAKSSMPNAQPKGAVQQAAFPRQPVSSELQAQIAKLQAETQQRYLIALNQLQLLRLSQQIADVNKDIAASKLDTVKSEKEIVDMLTKPATPVETARNYSQNLGSPFTMGAVPTQPVQEQAAAAATPTPPPTTAETPAAAAAPAQQQEDTTIANYVVISVSNLLNKWSAVLGYQGRLYSVYVGDVMPIDGAMVKSIDKYSVILEKGNTQKKLSLVPII